MTIIIFTIWGIVWNLDIHKYGVIKPGETNGKTILIEDIIEKPSPQTAPSDIAACGRYILNPSIFKHLKLIKSDLTGEIQLTDAIKSLLSEEKVYGELYEGQKFDCGSKKGFVHATIALALKDETLKEDIKNIIKDIFWIFFSRYLNYCRQRLLIRFL